MPRVRWKKFRRYSGPLVMPRTAELPTPDMHSSHWDRAFWLTTMVESGGRPGLVNMYDGCGATCGLHQAIAVYPRNLRKQGPLWSLLWRLDAVIPISYYSLGELLDDQQWDLSAVGLRGRDGLVDPRAIRDTLTPVGGRVPESGPRWEQSRAWALAFSEIFAKKAGLRTQINFGVEHLHKSAERVKVNGTKIVDACYNGTIESANGRRISAAWDLAMSLFWCNFVNGPSPSKKALARAAGASVPSKALVEYLGNNTYGRWDDDIPGGRYQRARDYAMRVWPRRLFEGRGAVMPKDLPG